MTKTQIPQANQESLSVSQSISYRKEYLLKARDYTLNLGRETRIMGVINMTPDSFSQDGYLDESKNNAVHKAYLTAQKFIRQGANIIDIGGESSRPGSTQISIKEEISHVIPLIQKINKHYQIPISIDTYKSRVAKEALEAGACIINNIKGINLDTSLLKMVKNYDAALCLMHMKKTPKNMQNNIRYKNIIPEIIASLQKSVEKCLEIGIKSDRIIIDPGIGFGKTPDHNLEILKRLEDFKILNLPLLIGTSRKSFIGHITNKDVKNRLMGSIASNVLATRQGAHILRVHDVAKIKEAILVSDAILNIN